MAKQRYEEKWIDEIFDEIFYDGRLRVHNVHINQSENTSTSPIQPPTLQALDSSWPNDDTISPNDAPYRIHTDTWTIDGIKWTQTSEGQWKPTDVAPGPEPPPTDLVYHFENLGYPIDDMGASDTTINATRKPIDTRTKVSFQTQMDSGANTSATNDINRLRDVIWIKPFNVGSANSSPHTSMKMLAIGRLPLYDTHNKERIDVACYYSPQIDGTIISPQAICKEFNNRFSGWIKFCKLDTRMGHIYFSPRDGKRPLRLGIYEQADLWYHDFNDEPTTSTVRRQKRINKLNSAAEWELWHQRLGHSSPRVMAQMHKHALGIPNLKHRSLH